MKALATLAFSSMLGFQIVGGDVHLQLRNRTVYIVPMGNGMDRHLASRLTSSGVADVVLDPEKAQAVLTDRIDDGFWTWSNIHYKHPNVTASATLDGPVRPGRGRYRGTVFLVDPRAGMVLWSVYEPTQDLSPDALDNTAERVVGHLKKSLKGK